MLENQKKDVGLYGFTGCNGDQLTIIHSEDKLLDFWQSVHIKSFSLAKSDNDDSDLDIALVEGSISNQEQAEHMKEIRKRSKKLIAIGNCACYGGVQAMELGSKGWDQRFRKVYGDAFFELRTPIESKPIDVFVDVDFYIPGCPINADQFFYCFAHLIQDHVPTIPDHPVCAECRWRENDCLLLKGILCLGPLTASGCNAVCPSHNLPCLGCWGPVEEANVSSEFNLLKEKGLTQEEIKRRFRMHNGSGIIKPLKKILGVL
ncbi:NADH:ubiquinone oxidoreductase [bacterium]|nr:NADH:ubiquinone oxidoreductase [bacterium]